MKRNPQENQSTSGKRKQCHGKQRNTNNPLRVRWQTSFVKLSSILVTQGREGVMTPFVRKSRNLWQKFFKDTWVRVHFVKQVLYILSSTQLVGDEGSNQIVSKKPLSVTKSACQRPFTTILSLISACHIKSSNSK